MRAAERKRGEDPVPLSHYVSSTERIISLPEKIPDDLSEKVKGSLAMIIMAGKNAGFDIKTTSKEFTSTDVNLLEACYVNIEGFFYSVKRDRVQLVDGTPKPQKRGWDFGMWYSYVGITNDNTGGDYCKIPRVVNFLPELEVWKRGESAASKMRLTALLQDIAKFSSFPETQIKDVLKPMEYFVNKIVGKKPVPGTYTEEEFSLMVKDFEKRKSNVESRYENEGRTLVNDLQLPPGSGHRLTTFLDGLVTRHSREVKRIAEYASNRISYLLVQAPRVRGSRGQAKTIAKGQTLQDKLITIGSGNTIRNIGKVLYSPLMEDKNITLNVFIDNGVNESRKLMNEKRSYVGDLIRELGGYSKEDFTVPIKEQFEGLMKIKPYISLIASTYMEIYQECVGIASWDAAFAAPKK